MLYAYRLVTSGLEQMPIESDLKEALWIDLLNPLEAQAGLGRCRRWRPLV